MVVLLLLFWRCGGGGCGDGGSVRGDGGSVRGGWSIFFFFFFLAGSTSVAQYGLTCYVDEDGLELVAILLVQCGRC